MHQGLYLQWGTAREAMACERCSWRYVVTQSQVPTQCPYCYHSQLVPLGDPGVNLPYPYPPESVVPFTISKQQLESNLENFIRGVPFAPRDMNIKSLRARIGRIFLPMWLVDADITAKWHAELGFNYQVISHQDRFDQGSGGWTSHELEETRVRWEPRLGHLKRTYHNVHTSALEGEQDIETVISMYDTSKAEGYTQETVMDSMVRLPDREPEDAWGAAKPAFQSLAAEECRKAAGGDHIRQFTWTPEYTNKFWTLMLLPLYNSYYYSDDNTPQRIMINGQTGQLIGKRIASMKRAQKVSLIVLGIALLIFLISVGISAASVFLPVLLAIGVLGLAVALCVGLGAIIPVATVWWFNRQAS